MTTVHRSRVLPACGLRWTWGRLNAGIVASFTDFFLFVFAAFADAAVAPIDFPIAPAFAVPKVRISPSPSTQHSQTLLQSKQLQTGCTHGITRINVDKSGCRKSSKHQHCHLLATDDTTTSCPHRKIHFILNSHFARARVFVVKGPECSRVEDRRCPYVGDQ